MYSNKKTAGSLLIIGGILCILGIIVAEALYPGYSTSENYISDLGVGPSALIFNISVFLLGLLTIFAAFFIQRAYETLPFSILAAIAGVGAIGVGLFPEDAGPLHFVFSAITFLFGGISAIVSYKLERPPLSYLSVILGLSSLVALILFASSNYQGLGAGGMERLVAYPTLLWAVTFGGYLIGDSGN